MRVSEWGRARKVAVVVTELQELLAGLARSVAAAQQPRLLLRKLEAAEACAMSVDSFDRYVLPEVRVVRRGSLVLVPVAELERWIVEAAELTLEEAWR